MTIIAIRDGVMAVDSQIGTEYIRAGTIQKWRKVLDAHGGGFIASTGKSGPCAAGMDGFANSGGNIECSDATFMHLRADGSVWQSANGVWYTYDAPFYVEGFGSEVALGAFAVGATAKQAAKAACKYSTGCGGKVHVLRLTA